MPTHSHDHSVAHAMIDNMKDLYYISKYHMNKKSSQEMFGFVIFSHFMYA